MNANRVIQDIGTVVQAVRERWATEGVPTVADDPDTIPVEGAGAPYYSFGHRLEISRSLLIKGQDKVNKFKKYPLIALQMPFPEAWNNGMNRLRLNVAILAFTDKKYNSAQRLVNVYQPILYPLYEMFMEEIRNSGLFFWDGKLDQRRAPHTKIDRMFWGTQYSEGNDKYIFNDPLDAIEIVDLQISQNIKC